MAQQHAKEKFLICASFSNIHFIQSLHLSNTTVHICTVPKEPGVFHFERQVSSGLETSLGH
jgi:hypothetical protein